LVGPQFHYIWNEKLGEELYDWRNDPEERHDLAKNRESSAVLLTFRGSLEHHGFNLQEAQSPPRSTDGIAPAR